MPSFLSWFEVDWRWSELKPAEQEIVRRYHAVLEEEPDLESFDTLRGRLAKASNELPGRTIRARCVDADDDAETELEFSVCDGDFDDTSEDFEPSGKVPA